MKLCQMSNRRRRVGDKGDGLRAELEKTRARLEIRDDSRVLGGV